LRYNAASGNLVPAASQLVGEENPVNGDREGLFRTYLHVDLDYLPALASAVNEGPWLGNRFVTIHAEIALFRFPSSKLCKSRRVTMLQDHQHAIHFKHILYFGERQVYNGKYSEHRRVSIHYGDGCRSLHCRAIRSASDPVAGDFSAARAALNPNASTPCVGSEGP
jgi:hypothetical protein